MNVEYLIHLANLADPIARYYFKRQDLYVESKDNGSPVSQADLEIETMIRHQLETSGFLCGVWGEEFGMDEQQPCRLIVDPIDATRNFIRGVPIFATLLALEVAGEIVAGVVSAPLLEQRWWAQKGEGSYLNGCRIQVSSIQSLERSQVFHGSLFGCEADTVPKSVLSLLAKTDRQRGFGDFYSHVMVAAGAGEFSLDFGLKPWDMAPLKVIVEEAGGNVTNLTDKFSLMESSLVCSNGQFHAELLAILSQEK